METFIKLWREYHSQNIPKNLREGQYLMILLHEFSPGAYLNITGTLDDCFYVDHRIERTLERLSKYVS